MPIQAYDPDFGGKQGSATKALNSMRQQYGLMKGTSVFYATAARNRDRRLGRKPKTHLGRPLS